MAERSLSCLFGGKAKKKKGEEGGVRWGIGKGRKRKRGRKVNTFNKNFIKFSEWFSLMRAIDGVCSLQALWRQQLMLHVPGGGNCERHWDGGCFQKCVALPQTPSHRPFAFFYSIVKPPPLTVSLLKFSNLEIEQPHLLVLSYC